MTLEDISKRFSEEMPENDVEILIFWDCEKCGFHAVAGRVFPGGVIYHDGKEWKGLMTMEEAKESSIHWAKLKTVLNLDTIDKRNRVNIEV